MQAQPDDLINRSHISGDRRVELFQRGGGGRGERGQRGGEAKVRRGMLCVQGSERQATHATQPPGGLDEKLHTKHNRGFCSPS
jgi:hypothetical protein